MTNSLIGESWVYTLNNEAVKGMKIAKKGIWAVVAKDQIFELDSIFVGEVMEINLSEYRYISSFLLPFSLFGPLHPHLHL